MEQLSLNRRGLLGLIAAGSAAAALPGSTSGATDAVMIPWADMSSRTQCMVILDYFNAATLEGKHHYCTTLRASGDPIMKQFADTLMPEFSGPGIYEFKLLERGVSPVAFLDRAPGRDSPLTGPGYRWRHYDRRHARFQGRAAYVAGNAIQLVRKVEAFA